jgi:hypothetical protein
MKACCPPGDGCNAIGPPARCLLDVLRGDASEEARRALSLWEQLEQARGPGTARERRFLRRAFGRSRDRAVGEWTPWSETAA